MTNCGKTSKPQLGRRNEWGRHIRSWGTRSQRRGLLLKWGGRNSTTLADRFRTRGHRRTTYGSTSAHWTDW